MASATSSSARPGSSAGAGLGRAGPSSSTPGRLVAWVTSTGSCSTRAARRPASRRSSSRLRRRRGPSPSAGSTSASRRRTPSATLRRPSPGARSDGPRQQRGLRRLARARSDISPRLIRPVRRVDPPAVLDAREHPDVAVLVRLAARPCRHLAARGGIPVSRYGGRSPTLEDERRDPARPKGADIVLLSPAELAARFPWLALDGIVALARPLGRRLVRWLRARPGAPDPGSRQGALEL